MESINPMMAVWAEALVETIPPPELLALREGISFEVYWYRCNHLVSNVEERGEKQFVSVFRCAVHENRPNVCVNFQPGFQGGYLHSRDCILYNECSYKKEWPQEEP